MKDRKKIIKALELCTSSDPDKCDKCPYGDNCDEADKDALALIKELLERPVPNDEKICKLHDQLCCVTLERDRAYADLAEAQKELTVLRAVKATAEAFLGVKIDG